MSSYHELKRKLDQWNKQTSDYLAQIEQLINKKQEETQYQTSSRLTGYFTSSMHAVHHKKQENVLLGDFYIKNNGMEAVRDLNICLRIQATTRFDFSGKYHLKNSNLNKNSFPSVWERVEQESEEDYWFKKIDDGILEPADTIAFPNFQLKWRADDNYAISIEGFVYCSLEKDGIPSLNQINVSGEI
ncbi:hypothetical protein [Sediminibacillus albus]|uniref:Uncharacterized protein n=1 Tax=Sediminibacillus albus TaxID=407036 RepID=A0A1G9AMI2_9BACI|nr:hypothetical protein [Sediminibacillus albus]SDK28497.1 hypothetical protein SAMN05216243_2612 [Sediminibacillus albus]